MARRKGGKEIERILNGSRPSVIIDGPRHSKLRRSFDLSSSPAPPTPPPSKIPKSTLSKTKTGKGQVAKQTEKKEKEENVYRSISAQEEIQDESKSKRTKPSILPNLVNSVSVSSQSFCVPSVKSKEAIQPSQSCKLIEEKENLETESECTEVTYLYDDSLKNCEESSKSSRP